MFYQLFYFKQLNSDFVHSSPASLIRGIHVKQALFYIPDHLNEFTCIHSKEKIDFLQVNDDYCDCLDGSDEPGTNACSNGMFFCLFQDSRKKYRRVIPSTMVNDGICDCCDGSDEWSAAPLTFRFNGEFFNVEVFLESKHWILNFFLLIITNASLF